ncbi:hypothetical protein COV24_01825 [candidate division WWE3 bacterium CG10_big_fil_rev_8_21_14_0_10_32_10]|uniref:Uncharacterized protein n=1 Tax=candidate division WWE3 bacterium CG10_big_fil_rev_8_21_14_0_10_32_10 TaxID=1975090 RepID=A0A2H0RAQ4_UNCKA|nr:MAG: hypothetical protein COV24_01825 [candidate division WWE3 bacterium CG10_big_fil_rev_8_21_14_0_10_32_10]
MKLIPIFIRVVLIIYFIFLSLFWAIAVAFELVFLFAGLIVGLTIYTPIAHFTYLVLFVLVLYFLLSKKQKSYSYAFWTLFFTFFTNTLYRYFFISDLTLSVVDLHNFLLFGLPAILSAILYKNDIK